MENNRKVLVSFVEKAPRAAAPSLHQPRFLALTPDGKRLVCLPSTSSSVPAKRCRLIGVLTEKNPPAETSVRRPIPIAPKVSPSKLLLPPGGAEDNEENCLINGTGGGGKLQRIPRPANAFMLFANDWRKRLAVENPRESNKDISVRLGVLWKNMSKDVKEKYFTLAREVDAEHKRKYPDYVYNPKEARLRKAMREQTRELSRSITTTTPSTTNSSSSNNNINSSSTSSSSILGGSSSSGTTAAAATMSPLPGAASAANRIIAGPWFPLGGAPPPPATHPKPILSPRVMAAHQRTLDKTKDAIRKQLECGLSSNGAGYPGSGYPGGGDYASSSGTSANGPVVTPDNNGDYCAVSDFADGQKWHPYQNGMNAYHSRSALMSKMSSLHRSMQSPSPHAAPTWGQFCNVPFSTSQSAMMRSNRHMVFLQEQQQQQQQQQQHCGYPTAAADEMQMSYEAKVQDELARRLHSSYSAAPVSSQEDQQVKSPLTGLHLAQLPMEEPKHASLSNGHHHHHHHHPQQQQQQQHHHHSHHLPPQQPHPHHQPPPPPPDDGPRWGTPRPPSVASSSCTTDAILDRDSDSTPQQQQQQRSSSSNSISKQPLPGFQQAFGSTEIGRFSRSELFASLVEAASNSTNNVSSNSGSRSSESEEPSTPTQQQQQQQQRYDAAGCRSPSPEQPLAGAGGSSYGYNNNHNNHAGGQESTGMVMPRWHSPYAGAIGSEI